MEKMIRSFGRTELAQRYFPGLTPDGAWHKLRAWLHRQQRYSLSTLSWESRRNNHFSEILRILFQSKSHCHYDKWLSFNTYTTN